MKDSKVTIQLTNEQQKQIKDVTGKSITALNIDLAATGQLSAQELDSVSGGTAFVFHKVTDKSSPSF
jgi:hypothetical protein